MDREEVIRIAREAGAATGNIAPGAPESIFPAYMNVERFASLVAAAERERIKAETQKKEWFPPIEPNNIRGDFDGTDSA